MLGRIISIVFVSVLAVLIFTSTSLAQLVITSVFDGPLPDGLPKGVDAPRDRLLSWIALSSTRQIFDHAPGINLEGRMDSDTDGYIFKKVFDGAFGSLSLGYIARPGLSQFDILRDLSAIVSLNGENDDFNGIDLIYLAPVPEPGSLTLNVVGLGCFWFPRNKVA